MNPISVGELVLYVSDALGVRVLGVVTAVINSGEAHMGPYYRISWNHPSYYSMENTVYDMEQTMLWRRCFIEFQST